MIFQSVAIPLVLFLVVNFPLTEYAWIFWLGTGLMWSTILITIWSGIPLFGIRSLLRPETIPPYAITVLTCFDRYSQIMPGTLGSRPWSVPLSSRPSTARLGRQNSPC